MRAGGREPDMRTGGRGPDNPNTLLKRRFQ